MACLDTCFLLDLAGGGGKRRKQRAIFKLRELVERGDSLFITRMSIAELYVGVYRADDSRAEEQKIRTLCRGFAILDFGEPETRVFGSVTAHLQRIGRPAGDMDVLIASMALTGGHSLITDNTAHFADIPHLITEEY